MPTASQAIQTLLRAAPHNSHEMAWWYNEDMEVQVMVAADNGEPVAGKKNVWSDGITEWGNFRIPKNADSDPIDNDYPMRWPLHEHVDAIGMTGWDWRHRKSVRVGFDFDSIIGHAAGVGVSDEELARVQAALELIPQTWLFKSTSGRGLHLYLEFDPQNRPDTSNHHEHAALARACLGMLSNMVNYPFESVLDGQGGNMWVWSRKSTKENQGLLCLKKGEGYFEPPVHWRDHIDVVTKKRSKVQIRGVNGDEVEEVAASRRNVPLDAVHRKIIAELQTLNYSTYWVADHNMLQTHTCALLEVFRNFAQRGDPLAGQFETISEGSSDDPGKPNCFCFPCHNGVFKVIRFGQKTPEHVSWQRDGKQWTYCYFNKKLDLVSAAALYGGLENPAAGGGYTFPRAEDALEAIKRLGETFTLPTQLVGKPTLLKPHKDGRIIVEVKYKSDEDVPGFIREKGKYLKLLNIKASSSIEDNEKQEAFDIATLDQMVRALLTINHEDAGWAYFDAEKQIWTRRLKDNVRSALKAKNFDADATEKILGHSVDKAWTMVNIPFQPEYPGNRQWNIDSPQFRFVPKEWEDSISLHPHWDLILEHCGEELTAALKQLEWGRKNNIVTGKDYLLRWIASLVRKPFEPLPYLFFFGPQNSGKSIFHEAISLLVKDQKGVIPADNALKSSGGFNGELANAFLCVVEETDLSKDKSNAYNRIKEWVTAQMISIHPKSKQVYKQPNTTHWVQCANEASYCPIFPGDTRITMTYVSPLEVEIPKHKLLKKLEEEAPYFLHTLLTTQLPEINSRLGLPVVITASKQQAEWLNKTPLELFLENHCFEIAGVKTNFETFYQMFEDTLSSTEKAQWNIRRVRQLLPPHLPVGKDDKGDQCIGNISLSDQESKSFKYVNIDGFLKKGVS